MYVGQSVDVRKRLLTHRRELINGSHHNKHLQRAWNKYGEDAFVFVPALWCAAEELTKYEQLVADRLRRMRPLFNNGDYLDSPVRGVPNPGAAEMMRKRHADPEFAARRDAQARINARALKTPAAKARFADVMRKLYSDPEYVEKRANIMRKTMENPEMRRKVAEKGRSTMQKLWGSEEFAAKTRERLAVQMRDPDFQAKRVTALSAKHKDEEFTKRRLALSLEKRAVKVRHIPTGTVFDTIAEACAFEARSTIFWHLKGKTKNVRWEYVDGR